MFGGSTGDSADVPVIVRKKHGGVLLGVVPDVVPDVVRFRYVMQRTHPTQSKRTPEAFPAKKQATRKAQNSPGHSASTIRADFGCSTGIVRQ